jgi:acetyl esterase/lipase
MARASVQRLITRKLLDLPSPLLRLMSGGGVVYQGGRTLDPRYQFLATQARGALPIATYGPEEARRAAASALAEVAGDPQPGVSDQPLVISSGAGDIPARAYRPERQDPEAPLLVFGHAGGGVIGDLESSHVFCTILARVARCPVLSVAYRLAPEHRFPAGLEDMLAAYRWARGAAERFGAPAQSAAIGGVSTGATFAAAATQMLRRAGEPQPVLQLLICPSVDVTSESPSMTTYGDAFPLSRAIIDWFAGHYIGPEADPSDPRLSPLREPDLAGLAPAVVVTAGFDPLLDQGEAYARRLREAGVSVSYRCYDSLAHGFTDHTGAVPAADLACREIATLLREGLEGGSPEQRRR